MILQAIRKFDLIGKFYTSKLGNQWIQNKLKAVFPHLNQHEKHIDIGCGNGMITHTLRQQQYHCTPLDVANLSIIPTVDVIVYDGLTMPFEDKKFDTALLLTVLHHTPDPVPVLKETARIAKKIIIIEDIYRNKIQQYMTYAMDTLVNLGHSSMTYQNKSDQEWKATFEALDLELVEESSKSVLFFFRQATYVLKSIH
ncbi:class I SAM-dependent methyltransferase [Aureispira anguillae]|uniref:Class I SAM-dependent methyltransferase n=1 Tax=Aureispira anguillae TaxID=2864201 RepID=A0A916DQU4_9BACT|nr:class I SAM-dependent methyltransferase [Aureispira anguillae]BDS10285.1 class I SAM-dependent methyltransferase [Aureispira anguillae]